MYQFLQPISYEIFEKKYDLYNEGSVESIFYNIAKEISWAEKDKSIREKWRDNFYEEMIQGRFIPAGRILANARTFSKMKNYNNCFTISINDNMEGIYTSLYEDAMISRTGGGVGFNISNLRPKNAPLKSLQGGVSSGPMSFLKVFNESAKIIQTGGYRRAAHIAILNIDHPDIEEFIEAKKGDENKEFTQFNISVGITDDFIDAVENDTDWELKFDGEVYKKVKAKDLYNKIVKNAYIHNEPGIFNIDTVNKNNNGWYKHYIQEANPCGEQPLPPYNVCDLGSINLSQFVYKIFEKDTYLDWESLKITIQRSIRFLDNVLDRTDYPLEKIQEQALNYRRIGLGFTGFGDMLAMLGIEYGSKESKEFTEKLGSFFRDEAYKYSIDLAKEKGAFPWYDKKMIESEFIQKMPKDIIKEIKKYGMRNVTVLSVAPTGTISFSLGNNCSSGVEPIFSLQYERNIRTGRGDETKKETISDYAWLKYKEKFGENSERPSYFTTTMEINPYDAIDIQSIWQKYIDSAISKTLNLPKDYSEKDYSKLFLYSYKNNLKGFTTFNPFNGSMKGVLEHKDESEEDELYQTPIDDNGRPITIQRLHAPKRPQDLECDIHQISVNKEKHIVLIGRLHDGSIYEVFVTPNPDKEIDIGTYKHGVIRKVKKSHYQLIVPNGEEKTIVNDIGKEFNETYASLSRFISLGLRHGADLQFIVTQLQKDTSFASFEKAVARILKKYIKEGEKVKVSESCPMCGSTHMIYKEGCLTCGDCGWSKCD